MFARKVQPGKGRQDCVQLAACRSSLLAALGEACQAGLADAAGVGACMMGTSAKGSVSVHHSAANKPHGPGVLMTEHSASQEAIEVRN